MSDPKQIRILLVEDSAGDEFLTRELFKEAKLLNVIYTVRDGIDALSFLRKEGTYKDMELPDLILLDLNMPNMDGRKFLEIVKEDDKLKHIPVVILTSSSSDADMIKMYNLHANAYVTKPFGLDEFISVVKTISDFWMAVVSLPPRSK